MLYFTLLGGQVLSTQHDTTASLLSLTLCLAYLQVVWSKKFISGTTTWLIRAQSWVVMLWSWKFRTREQPVVLWSSSCSGRETPVTLSVSSALLSGWKSMVVVAAATERLVAAIQHAPVIVKTTKVSWGTDNSWLDYVRTFPRQAHWM